jgi:hypothetical protein
VFVTEENNAFAKKRPSLIAKNRKESSFYKENFLVELTPCGGRI